MPENEPAFTVTVCQAPDHGYTGRLGQTNNYHNHRWPNRIAAWIGLRSLLRTRWPTMVQLGLVEVRYDYPPKPPTPGAN